MAESIQGADFDQALEDLFVDSSGVDDKKEVGKRSKGADFGPGLGDAVAGGTQLGVLGDDQSEQTDGERKHLHFGLYPYTSTELYAGYVANDADLVNWVNPADWLRTHGATAGL